MYIQGMCKYLKSNINEYSVYKMHPFKSKNKKNILKKYLILQLLLYLNLHVDIQNVPTLNIQVYLTFIYQSILINLLTINDLINHHSLRTFIHTFIHKNTGIIQVYNQATGISPVTKC